MLIFCFCSILHFSSCKKGKIQIKSTLSLFSKDDYINPLVFGVFSVEFLSAFRRFFSFFSVKVVVMKWEWTLQNSILKEDWAKREFWFINRIKVYHFFYHRFYQHQADIFLVRPRGRIRHQLQQFKTGLL